MRAFVLSHCVLFCPILLSYLGSLLFSEEDMEEQWVWGREKVEGGETAQDALYERRLLLSILKKSLFSSQGS